VDSDRLLIAPFIKEYTARWYNSKYSKILDAWLDIFFLNNAELNISAFANSTEGFNAHYKLKRESAYSKTF
jgi:hypothetical protein